MLFLARHSGRRAYSVLGYFVPGRVSASAWRKTTTCVSGHLERNRTSCGRSWLAWALQSYAGVAGGKEVSDER